MDSVKSEVATLYSEHEISSGCFRIVLSVWEPSKPEAAVVFIPATMTHSLIFEPLLSCFAEKGFAVIGLHPVGHGKSSHDVKRFTISDMVQNARDAVTFAIERFGVPVIVMGSSQGGVVAAALASEDDRIAAVFPHGILLSELPDSIGISRFPFWLRHVYRPMQTVLRFFAWLFPDLKFPIGFYLDRMRIAKHAQIWDAFESDLLCPKRYSLHYLISLITTRYPGLTDGSIRCPVYVVADSGDEVFKLAYIQQVFELLQAPYKEMVMFHHNEHMFMVIHPKEVCSVLSKKMREALRNHECTKAQKD